MNRIFLTVDVECHNIQQKNLYIDGKIRNSYWGISKILEIGKEKNIPINFFVDVVECHEYGDSFITEIVDLIHSYGQKIYLHIHPNFLISGGYHYFWQYSKEEQKDIILNSIDDFERLVGYRCKAIRTGGYCNDQNYYDALMETAGSSIIDVSHCMDYRNCHYHAPVINRFFYNNTVPVLPNTRFLCFKLLKWRKFANLDIMSANYNEMKRIIQHKELNYMTCTMHSWNLFKHMYYIPCTMRPDKYNCRKMRKFIDYAKENGWTFSDFEEPLLEQGKDSDLDLCCSLLDKIRGVANTFLRMQRAARFNKKYFLAYSIFYSALIVAIILLIIIF